MTAMAVDPASGGLDAAEILASRRLVRSPRACAAGAASAARSRCGSRTTTSIHVAIMPTRVVQRDDAAERLAEIVTMQRQLCDEHVAAEHQAAHLEDAMLRRLWSPSHSQAIPALQWSEYQAPIRIALAM